jgi:hypothetical protein
MSSIAPFEVPYSRNRSFLQANIGRFVATHLLLKHIFHHLFHGEGTQVRIRLSRSAGALIEQAACSASQVSEEGRLHGKVSNSLP